VGNKKRNFQRSKTGRNRRPSSLCYGFVHCIVHWCCCCAWAVARGCARASVSDRHSRQGLVRHTTVRCLLQGRCPRSPSSTSCHGKPPHVLARLQRTCAGACLFLGMSQHWSASHDATPCAESSTQHHALRDGCHAPRRPNDIGDYRLWRATEIGLGLAPQRPGAFERFLNQVPLNLLSVLQCKSFASCFYLN